MRKSLKINLLFPLLGLLAFASCNKEGAGGTSSITGIVEGIDHDEAQAEITQITFTNGDVIEHGDYFTLNSPDTNQYFYVWYDNPTWVSNGDPGLQNRIGISVSFNYSDSNLDIAMNTKNAIENASGMFTSELYNDVLVLTAVQTGNCPDAEDVSSPFAIDIMNQGKASFLGEAQAQIDERVYIEYGDNTIANDDVRTVAEGKFQFTNLQKGNYTIYVSSKDTLNGGSTIVSKEVVIDGNNSVIDAGTLQLIY